MSSQSSEAALDNYLGSLFRNSSDTDVVFSISWHRLRGARSLPLHSAIAMQTHEVCACASAPAPSKPPTSCSRFRAVHELSCPGSLPGRPQLETLEYCRSLLGFYHHSEYQFGCIAYVCTDIYAKLWKPLLSRVLA